MVSLCGYWGLARVKKYSCRINSLYTLILKQFILQFGRIARSHIYHVNWSAAEATQKFLSRMLQPISPLPAPTEGHLGCFQGRDNLKHAFLCICKSFFSLFRILRLTACTDNAVFLSSVTSTAKAYLIVFLSWLTSLSLHFLRLYFCSYDHLPRSALVITLSPGLSLL